MARGTRVGVLIARVPGPSDRVDGGMDRGSCAYLAGHSGEGPWFLCHATVLAMADGGGTGSSEDDADTREADDAYLAFIAAADWGRVAKVVTYLLIKRKVPEADRSTLLSEVVLRITDPRRSPWKPERHGPLERHALSVCSSVVSNDRTKADNSKTEPMAEVVVEEMPDSERHAEVDLLARERASRAMAALQKRLADHPLALRVLLLEERFVIDPEEQSLALGATLKQVYKARQALFEAVRDLSKSSSDSDIRVAMGGQRTQRPAGTGEAP